MNREQIIQLKTGTVAFEEYGDPAGEPVIFCHGWPSSRTMAELTDSAARRLGVRVISPDRPGISRSQFHAERKLVDWPDVLGALAAHLDIRKFRMLAISGGAPYAYVSAWAMPECVKAIAVISGAPPISELSDHTGLLPLYRWMLALYRRQPDLMRTLFRMARPFAQVWVPIRLRPMLLKFLQPCDSSSLRDSAAFQVCFESQRRAWRGSADGVLTDAQVYAAPWGFPLEEVTVPVRLWHGRKDRTFSTRIVEEMAARLPNCAAHYLDEAGHYSLPIRNMDRILADLMATG
jgi:pimeloyl-ACP methyl ester carboxylesterase